MRISAQFHVDSIQNIQIFIQEWFDILAKDDIF
jgi:hypothetical protein